MSQPHQPYLDAVLEHLPRALSLLDAQETSVSYGSFDRTWWCWKFTDFSASRFQEGCYLLAWLYGSPLAPEGWRGNKQLLEWLEAAMLFWTGLQHKDGSFDEAYPFERSLAATAFTAFYVGSAYERVRGQLSAECCRKVEQALRGAGEWLARNGEFHGVLSNHLAAAAAALQVVGDVLGTSAFYGARDRYLGTIYENQDPQEGWLREYGGADPGYQTHGMFYLADIWRRTKDARLHGCLEKATAFIAWFIHPDGTVGGEYASRGTQFAFPAGFEMMAGAVAQADAIAGALREHVVARRGIGLASMDVWNIFPMLNNYLFAMEAAQDLPEKTLPWQESGVSRLFSNAGLAVLQQGRLLTVISPGLGGAHKQWQLPEGVLVKEDCGYALWQGKRVYTSQSPSEWVQEGNGYQITAPFKAINRTRFNPYLFIGFRGFTLTVGRHPELAKWLKDLLVKVLIRKRSEMPAKAFRHIQLQEDGSLLCDDRFSGLPSGQTPRFIARAVPIHMGSSRYMGRYSFRRSH